jgi:hypothetical protein
MGEYVERLGDGVRPFRRQGPVGSPSWPQMMFTATPVRKPIMTEWETKRV